VARFTRDFYNPTTPFYLWATSLIKPNNMNSVELPKETKAGKGVNYVIGVWMIRSG
jgi:hypothetical protein